MKDEKISQWFDYMTGVGCWRDENETPTTSEVWREIHSQSLDKINQKFHNGSKMEAAGAKLWLR